MDSADRLELHPAVHRRAGVAVVEGELLADADRLQPVGRDAAVVSKKRFTSSARSSESFRL